MKISKLWVLGIVMAALWLWLWGIFLPYVGLYSTNNNYLALAVRNYLRFGLLHLNLLPTYYTGIGPVPESAFYLHHPILIYLTAIVPFVIFGFKNWVVHVMPFIFNLASLLMIYAVAKEMYHRKIAIFAILLAAFFPMMTFFWKLIFFEPITLFFDLTVFYFAIRYLKKSQTKYLYLLAVCSFLAGLSDWPAIYWLFPFSFLLFTKYKIKAKYILLAYTIPLSVAFGLFFFSVYKILGNFSDLFLAGAGRAIHAEMTAVPFWWLKYPLNYLLRFIIYFTPLSIIYLILGAKSILTKRWRERTLTDLAMLMLFIFGLTNTLIFPTASWGYSYFLYYFIPFLAISGAKILNRINSRKVHIAVFLFIILWSITVNYFKIAQWQKHAWKYAALQVFASKFEPHEIIGIADFPGDLIENYYLHPTQILSRNEIIAWFAGLKYPNIKKVIYACPGICGVHDFELASEASSASTVISFRNSQYAAWIFIKNNYQNNASEPLPTSIVSESGKIRSTDESVSNVYRLLIKFLDLGQL